MIAQFFNPTNELVIPIGITNNEENAEIEVQPETVGAKTSKCYT